MRKFIAMVLAMSMVFTMGVNAFASAKGIQSEPEVINVALDDGRVVKVGIEEVFTAANDVRAEDTPSDGAPVIGSTKTFNIYVYNDEIDAALTVGEYIGTAAADDIAMIAAAVISAEVAAVATVAVGVSAMIAEKLISDNAKAGNEGFKLTITVVYDRVYYHAGGYYVDCYDYQRMRSSTF